MTCTKFDQATDLAKRLKAAPPEDRPAILRNEITGNGGNWNVPSEAGMAPPPCLIEAQVHGVAFSGHDLQELCRNYILVAARLLDAGCAHHGAWVLE